MNEQPTTLDRRRLLQLAAGGAAVAAVPAVRAGRAAAAPGVAALKVGVLVPTGGEVPAARSSFLAGVRLQLEHVRPQLRSSLAVEEVALGFGGARQAAERLLERDRADVVVAGITAPVARGLAPLFEAHRTPLLLANVGAHVVPRNARSAQVLHFGLDYWQSSFAFGAWAATHLGRRAVVAAPLADSGYDTIHGFRRGLESAGGRVVDILISHHHDGDPGLPDLLATAAAARPDFVYGLYSGRRAEEFLTAYRGSVALRSVPLAAGGLMVEESLGRRLAPQAAGVKNALPWARGLQGPANASFRSAYRARTGRLPDVFALLGFEAALLATTGAARAANSAPDLLDALAGLRVTAPRGTLAVDGPARTVHGPIYIREVRRVGGRLVNVRVATAGAAERRHDGLTELHTPLASGFLNEVLHGR